jgi:4-hydroxybenzoate polyprenyltransferase
MSTAGALLSACRPRQWIKNGLVLIPLFSSGSLGSGGAVTRTLLTAAAFALLSSSVYLMNDLADREFDAAHPAKKWRPIASGALSPRVAILASFLLFSAAMTLGVLPGGKVWAILVLYLLANVAYSAGLRKEPIVDVLIVSSGFVLRPIAGAYAIPVWVSPWLIVVSLLLALSISLLKRRSELMGLEGMAVDFRPALGGYSVRFLDLLVSITTGAGIISYALYTFQSQHSERLVFTLPLFLYGVFRYLYLVYERGAGATPEEIFLHDRPMQVDALLYLIALAAIAATGF